MRQILIFGIVASVSGSVFLLALVELFFTMRRRRANQVLQDNLKQLRANVNESINKITEEHEQKLESAEQKAALASGDIEKVKADLEKEYQKKIDEITSKSKHSLETARKRAKSLEDEAKQAAEVYLQARRKEVEDDLMNLVMSVTKKVLPEGLTTEIQKELVMRALRDLKTEES